VGHYRSSSAVKADAKSAGGPKRCVKKSLKLAECTALLIGVLAMAAPLYDFGVMAGARRA
jgi:hypothetical protein